MKLGVNVDHIATLRQARKAGFPDPLQGARVCEQAGCHSIVCHLRQDRRHINEFDLENLRRRVSSKLNLEMSCAQEIVRIALKVKPDQATLVPERREEVTTEGGLEVAGQKKKVARAVNRLLGSRISASLFIDPEKKQIMAAKEIGASCVELHTGRYANAKGHKAKKRQLQHLQEAAESASRLGLEVFAGHGLDYQNVKDIVLIKEIKELNIGFAIIARAIFSGLEQAVKEMLGLLAEK